MRIYKRKTNMNTSSSSQDNLRAAVVVAIIEKKISIRGVAKHWCLPCKILQSAKKKLKDRPSPRCKTRKGLKNVPC